MPPLFQSGKKENKDVGLNFTPTRTFGVSLDLYLKPKDETEQNMRRGDLHYFRLTYAFFHPKFHEKYAGTDGATHNLTLGYVMVYNAIKRVK